MQFVVFNTMSPLGSALPHLLGTLNSLSADNKIKIMRDLSPVVGALSQQLIFLFEIQSLKVLALDKLLFLRAMSRKLFKCLYDKW